MRTVAVIGGGASGMAAAITAAHNKNNHVVLYERQQRVGRKLLATGNGRCNLTNTGAMPADYHSENRKFAGQILGRFPVREELDFFHELGLVTVEEYGGRVYPLSDSANSVLDVLRMAVDAAGVETCCSSPVKEIRKRGKSFVIVTEESSRNADCVILACGGAAGAKLGGVSDGYELAKVLGHNRTRLYPALVNITTEPEYPRSLKGVRADAALSLTAGGKILAQSRGEVQFTENGISGPATFDISRAAATGGNGMQVCIDLLKDYSTAQVLEMLKKKTAAYPNMETGDLFTGVLHNRLGRMIVKYSGVNGNEPVNCLTPTELERAAQSAKAFTLKVRGTGDFSAAQVTAGGLKTDEFNPQTLESLKCPGLYACGEVLDVDGNCGGFNLHWAWASGRLAGRLSE